jgi:uncharacterized membrane protein
MLRYTKLVTVSRQQAVIALLVFFGLFIGCARANAKPEFPPIIESTYKLKTGGKLFSAAEDCTLCHTGPPKLNPYGKDVQAALNATGSKQLTPEILHSIDNKDSDGDGFTNAEEFAADTLPGDPTSKPAGTPKTTPKATTAATQTAGEPEQKSLASTVIGLMFPKQAQHPAIVHLPIGAYIVSILFDLLGVWKKNRTLTLVGYYNLMVAALTSLVAVATGLLAWWFAFGHSALQGDLLYHLLFALTTTALIWILWAMRFRSKDKSEPVSRAYIIIGIVAFLVIAVTGHLGGDLTGVN